MRKLQAANCPLTDAIHAQSILGYGRCHTSEEGGIFFICDDYCGYVFNLEKDDEGDDWYIQVGPLDRSYLYDGWWRDSADKGVLQAIEESLRGAMIRFI